MAAQLMTQNHSEQRKLSSLEDPAVEINGLLRYITCREKGNLFKQWGFVPRSLQGGPVVESNIHTHGHDLLRQGSYTAVWEMMRGG